MVYGDFKDLKRRTQADKVLKDNAFKYGSNPVHDGYQRGLASMVYKFFDKKVANELHKPIIRKFRKRTVCCSFKDNIWGVDSADIQLINKYKK